MTSTAAVLDLYQAHRRVELVEVPELLMVSVDGEGDPGGAAFADALRTLYGVTYPAHFLCRRRFGTAPRVMPLEALWWVAGGAATDTFTRVATREAGVEDVDRSLWRWRAFIVQPEPIDEGLLALAIAAMARRSATTPPPVTVRRWREGRCAQLLHLGPYDAEAATIDALHDGIAALGYRPRGRHHEIYLGDPHRSAPERLRTILRHPVAG